MDLSGDKDYIRALEKVDSLYSRLILRCQTSPKLKEGLEYALSNMHLEYDKLMIEELFLDEALTERRKQILVDACRGIRKAGVKNINPSKRRLLSGFFYKSYENFDGKTNESDTKLLISLGLRCLECELDFLAELEAKGVDIGPDVDRLQRYHFRNLTHIYKLIESESLMRDFID